MLRMARARRHPQPPVSTRGACLSRPRSPPVLVAQWKSDRLLSGRLWVRIPLGALCYTVVMEFMTATCRHCNEGFAYEPVKPRADFTHKRNLRKLTSRSVCDKCRKDPERKNRTPDKGF